MTEEVDRIISDLDRIESDLREWRNKGSVDHGLVGSDAWTEFSDVVFKGGQIDEDKARSLLQKIEGDLRSRYASRGENFDESEVQDKIKTLKGIFVQRIGLRGKRRKFSKYLSQLTDVLQHRDLEGVETVIHELESVQDNILGFEDSESSTVSFVLDDIERALHDLSASDSLELVLGYISTAKSNLKRYKAGKPPSGFVKFEDGETDKLHRYVRERKEFKRSDVQDEFGWSESKFYEKLRGLRRKCQVDVKEGTGTGSKPAVYIFRGRTY